MNVTTIGIDLAKSVFQLHGIDAAGEVIFRKKLRRSGVLDFLRDLPPCLIGLEACATHLKYKTSHAAGGVYPNIETETSNSTADNISYFSFVKPGDKLYLPPAQQVKIW